MTKIPDQEKAEPIRLPSGWIIPVAMIAAGAWVLTSVVTEIGSGYRMNQLAANGDKLSPEMIIAAMCYENPPLAEGDWDRKSICHAATERVVN
ncbi:MAG: hypothetical protein AAF661_16365 [Pseudomonadota bacterium]